MKLRPIPLYMLPSTAQVRVPKTSSRSYEEPVEIRHVRFFDVKLLETSDFAIEDGNTGVIYIDAANSEGAFPVPVGSLISIDGGDERAVVKTTAELGFDEIHHWKVEVR